MPNSIRIFLSSTFKDMQQERDYLVKTVFPMLRDIAEERGVPFSWCDLRFGVSAFDEEFILRLCLRNIDDSSPCFVGLLGSDYGSIPQYLSKEQIKRLSVFRGVPSMLKKQYGYTEIEMRYFISQKDKNDPFDFYFFVGDSHIYKKQSGFYDWKKVLTHPISTLTSFFLKHDVDKLEAWKQFVFINTNQEIPYYWKINKDKSIYDDTVYKKIKNKIEKVFPIPKHAKEELIWNEQQAYLQLQISKTLFVDDICRNIMYDESKDILNLYSTTATGKTICIANLLKQSIKNGFVCFYYFIGGSRNIDTPLTIWKCILYQVCKYKNVDYGLYKHVYDRDRLRNILTELLHQMPYDILIVIDGWGDDVSCSVEYKNTFISDFPDLKSNIRYIISSTQRIKETNRIVSLEHKLNNNVIKTFSKKYLKHCYGYSNTAKLTFYKLQPKDLREAQYIIDESIINISNGKDIDFCNEIYGNIKSRILDNIRNQCKFYQGNKQEQVFITIHNAILFISLTHNGILESDICDICNLNAEQWTILYSYLFPFFKSKGCIKLHKSIAEQFYSLEDVEAVRLQFIKSLLKYNISSQYTTEILYQASQLSEKKVLCEKLSDIDILLSVYEKDRDLLASYLADIDQSCLLDYFQMLLDNSLQDPKNIKLSIISRIIGIFHEVLPRLTVALHYIDIADAYISTVLFPFEHLLEYNAIKIKIYIEIGQFNKALDELQLSEILIQNYKTNTTKYHRYTIDNLLLKAKLYDNELQDENVKKNALIFYRKIIETYQECLEIDIVLDVLDRCIWLSTNREDRDEDRKKFTTLFSNDNIIKENSHLHNKFAIKQFIHTLLLNKSSDTQLDLDDVFSTLLSKIDECCLMYPYSKDNYSNLLWITKGLSNRVDRLCHKNAYEKYKGNVFVLQICCEKLVTLSDLIFSKESISYAKAMYQAAKLYEKLAHIKPLDKIELLNISVKYSLVAEEAFSKICPEYNMMVAQIYNDRAWIYNKLCDYKNASLCIDKAIDIKKNLRLQDEDSLFKSKLEKISLLINHIIHIEDICSFKENIQLCKSFLNILKAENINAINVLEEKRKDRIISIEKLEQQIDVYFVNDKERFLEVAKIVFEDCKRAKGQVGDDWQNIGYQECVQRVCAGKHLIDFFKKAKYLDSYLKQHGIYQIFHETYNDYIDFEENIINLCDEMLKLFDR